MSWNQNNPIFHSYYQKTISNLYGIYQTSFIHVREKDQSIKRQFQTSRFKKNLSSFLYSILRTNKMLAFNLTKHKIKNKRVSKGPKVLHVIRKIEIGGSQKIAFDLVRFLGTQFQMKILTAKISSHITFPDLPIIVLKTFQEISNFLEQEKFDVIHIHFWGINPWIKMFIDIATSRKAELRFKIIENCNNPIPIYFHEAIDFYVFVSDFVVGIQDAQIPKNKIQVVYPGVDTDDFYFFTKKVDRLSAGMVYRLTDDKIGRDAIELLIKICKTIPNILIYVIGSGPNLYHFIRRSIKESVRDQLNFLGFVPFDQLSQYYDQFNVYIAPVVRESYGIVVPYAMAKGNYIVDRNVDCLKELLGSEEYLSNTDEKFINDIKKILEAEDSNRMLLMQNRARAEQIFSLNKMLADYKNIYLKMTCQSS